MKIDILTLFPEAILPVIGTSIMKRATERGIVKINVINYRDFSDRKSKGVDDYPYGGGAGMIIGPQSIVECMRSIPGYEKARRIITSPAGKIFTQEKAKELAGIDHIIIICGHYEGIDHRVTEYVDEEISIGDYVLTGGEIPALAIVDSVVRLLPDVLGNGLSAEDESFYLGLLEYPQYTRPEDFENRKVPSVLLSGNHEKVRIWRRFMALERTKRERSDLLAKADLTEEDKKFLKLIEEGKEPPI